MNNKIKAVLILICVILLGMFTAQWIVVLPEFYQIFTIALFILTTILLLIKPRIGLDVKFLFFVCTGYAFGGKGFAYISPFEPFYVSEVCLVLCLIGFLLRFPDTWRSIFISKFGLLALFLFLAYSGSRLIFFDFPRFRMMAIRDACIAYYALYTFTTITACQREENLRLLKQMFLIMGPLALIGLTCNITGATMKIHEVFPYAKSLFAPHDDIASPILAASAATSFLKGASEAKPHYIMYALLAIIVLSFSKTAGVFCLLGLFGSLILFTQRKELIFSSILVSVILVVSFSIILLFGIDLNIESAHLNTFSEVVELDIHSGNSSTTSWRLSWWRIITEDTWKTCPLTGFGFGGDISGPFAEEVLGVRMTPEVLSQAGFSRYPHNIFFTILGRLGFPLVILFTLMQAGIYFRIGRFARQFLSRGRVDYGLFMMISFVIAGLANSFVQMTYEGPYAAIPHWVAIGGVYAYVMRARRVAKAQNAS